MLKTGGDEIRVRKSLIDDWMVRELCVGNKVE